MKIDLSRIVLDKSIYPRTGLSDFNVGRLVSALKTGSKLPPMIVEAKTFRLVDGWHRHAAYQKVEATNVDVEAKVYGSEADLFADAIRYNVGHGEPLDQYTIRSAIIRLTEYGYSKDKISDVVRLPIDQIEKIERGFATDATTGRPMALKGGLSHLRGHTLNPAQVAVNRHYSGSKASFYARQLYELLLNNMWPDSESFAAEMDRLTDLWNKIRSQDRVA